MSENKEIIAVRNLNNYSIEEIPFLMIKNQRDEYCPYTFVYGEKRFCTCPVKIELYHRYGI